MTTRTGDWHSVLVVALLASAASAASACSSSSSPSSVLVDSGVADSHSATDSGAPPPTDSGPVDSGHPADTATTPEAGGEDSGGGPTFDFTCGNKPACLLTQICCIDPTSMDPFSCVAPGACPAGDTLNCDGPDECVGTATPVCCATETTNKGGSYPSCTPGALGSKCTTASSCPTHLFTSCTDTTTVTICHEGADCMDPNNNQCCTFMSGTAQITFCTDSTTATLAGATCHP